MKRAFAWGVALAIWAGVGGVARAATCVGIAPDTGVLDGGRTRFVEQLGASLAQHGIAMCGPTDPPIAEVSFEPSDHAVAITVRDAVTRKAVTRSVQLSSVPRDGRPLALAVAADELLRATWAEILLARAPSPPPEAPKEVRAIVEASLDRSPPVNPSVIVSRAQDSDRPRAPSTGSSGLFVGAALAGEHATGGLTLAGVDARLEGWLGSRVALTLRLGGRIAASVDASDGTANASALLGGVGAAVALTPRNRRFVLTVPVRLDAERIQFEAHPSASARGSDAAAFGATASTGLCSSLRLAAGWSLDLEGSFGAVVHPVEADDRASTFTALSGVVFGAALGVRAAL